MRAIPFVNIRFITAFSCAVVLFSLCIAITKEAHAQTISPGETIGIRLEPQFPGPTQSVTASLDAYSLDTTGATITWSLDGVEMTESRNARSVTVMTGKLGEGKVLSATIRPLSGAPFTLRKEIVGTAVDIVVEAKTYVPSFYRGRALPSADSKVRIIAIPHIGGVNPQTLTYRWEQNGSVLLGGPVRGKQSVEVVTSRYYGGYITVSIYGGDGTMVAQRNIALDATAPELHFYEENPLRGLSELAVRGNISLIGEETTVHGEPYYLNMSGGETYAWTINGSPATANVDPHIITLRRTGAGGTAGIGLEVSSDLGIPEFVRGNFTINF